MMLSGRPLLATRADRRYVVARPEVERVVASAANGLNALVVGAPGSGKTTLLHQAARALGEHEGARSVYLNASHFDDGVAVLTAVADAVGGDRAPVAVAMGSLGQAVTPQPVDQLRDPSLRLVRLLRQAHDAVVLLDGLPPAISHALFGQLRDELWQTGVTWVVSGDTDDLARHLTPPADAFFETVVELAPLTDGQQAELIVRRRETGDPRWMADVRTARGTPRALLASLRNAQAAGSANAGAVLAARAERELAAERLGRLHSTMLAEIEDGAALSASDEQVLRRFGVSRQRAQQVLAKLEGRGLVESGMRPSSGGRPRKLYWRLGG